MTASEQYLDLSNAPTDALIEASWRAGDLSWLLLPHQVPVYEQYRRWEQRDPQTETRGQYARVFCLDWGKRTGKTGGRLVVRMEDCIRAPERIGRPGMYRFVTAFQRDIEEITGELLTLLLESCPKSLRPEFKGAYLDRPAGLYFPNGSRLAMAGLDKHPDALRGRASDGDDVSEAAFIKNLRYTLKNVIYHQYQQRPHARLCTESSAPKETDSTYDKEFVEDAKRRSCPQCRNASKERRECTAPDRDCAYSYGTIDDNTALSDGEREEFIRASGGRDDPECQREYFNKRVRDKAFAIVPEWDETKHVESVPVPEHAIALEALDPGTKDFAALLWGYIHYERAQLIVQRAWAKPNAGTPEIAEVCREGERLLWLGGDDEDCPLPTLTYWSGGKDGNLRDNPYIRTSDVGPRLLQDLAREHGLRFSNMDKSKRAGGGIQSELKHAGVNSLRTGLKRGQVVVDPEAVELIAQLNAGRWNKDHSEYEKSDEIRKLFGHWDLIDTLVVMWRAARHYLTRDPFPPHRVHDPPASYSRGPETHGNAVEYASDHDGRMRAGDAIQTLFGGSTRDHRSGVDARRAGRKQRRSRKWRPR